MSDVVMIVGYPAAGKSSVAKEYIDKGYVYLNRDQVGGSVIALLPKMEVAIENGKDVILDNTFPTIESRKPFIDSANVRKATVSCDWLQTSIEDAQFNACMRMMDRAGKILSPEEMKASKDPNLFPPVVLFKYKKEFQKPTMDEGFAMIIKREFNRIFPKDWTNKAIIFDYDGTLRDTISGAKFPCDPNDVKMLDLRKSILRDLAAEGWLFLGASNQSGIAKGSPTEEEAIACFEKTNELLGQDIDYSYCPHRVPPISCYCRKPMPGMAVELFWKYKLYPRQCIMVGDMTSDKTFAKRSHMQFMHADNFFSVELEAVEPV
jgi:HAD superfamily hydrolase (TIGR01662 family)